MSWKPVLYEYVHTRNQSEGENKEMPHLAFICDAPFLEAENRRIRRRGQMHKERGLQPIRHETRLKVLGTEETDDRVIAYLEYAKQFEYQIKNSEAREDRVERERVSLSRRGREWIINSISPYIADNDSTRPVNPSIDPGGTSDVLRSNVAAASGPLINKHIFSSHLGQDSRSIYYDRASVRAYADTWWNSYNPRFIHMEVDCTNFASQCLFAGKAPMHYTGKRESGWWYQGKSGDSELWSYSWAVAQSLQNYLLTSRSGLRALEVRSPAELTVGDVINYSWDGARFSHSTIVTAMAPDGMPLVNAHTINSRYRYWSYRDSYAWTERTLYRFLHIPDQL